MISCGVMPSALRLTTCATEIRSPRNAALPQDVGAMGDPVQGLHGFPPCPYFRLDDAPPARRVAR